MGDRGFTYLVIVADFADWRGPYRREAVEKPTLAPKTLVSTLFGRGRFTLPLLNS